MEPSFWHSKWEKGEIGFHESDGNVHLKMFWDTLELEPGHTVFVPLCGKTRDIAWMLDKEISVVGVELNQSAIEQLFVELNLEPHIAHDERWIRYSAPNLTVYVGDFFNLSAKQIGPVNATYDRAALVALPELMQRDYSKHMVEITRNAPQLVIAFEYDQSVMDGPPFSISAAMFEDYYQPYYQLTLLEKSDIPLGLKGKMDIINYVWLLKSDIVR